MGGMLERTLWNRNTECDRDRTGSAFIAEIGALQSGHLPDEKSDNLHPQRDYYNK